MSDSTTSRDWDWKTDGALDGPYVKTRSVHVSRGPSAGQSKLVFDFYVDGESVTVWPPTVLMRHFREELQRRGKDDLEPNERVKITPLGKHPEKGYWLFEDTVFEHAAPRPSALDMLAAFSVENGEPDALADVEGLQAAKVSAGIAESARSAEEVDDGRVPF
jgi:hypothetical protein